MRQKDMRRNATERDEAEYDKKGWRGGEGREISFGRKVRKLIVSDSCGLHNDEDYCEGNILAFKI